MLVTAFGTCANRAYIYVSVLDQMARPKRGEAHQQKTPYLLGKFDVVPCRLIPPKCTTAKSIALS